MSKAAKPAIYAGMLYQEHCDNVVNFLPKKSTYTFSNVGCSIGNIALYVEFASVEDQKDFEDRIKTYEVKRWS